VLKIHTTRGEDRILTVQLCGQLTGEYVPELQGTLSPDAAPQIVLDLSEVTFVDRTAMEFLCGVKSRVHIQNIPPYVMRWIEQEFRCGASSKNSRKDW